MMQFVERVESYSAHRPAVKWSGPGVPGHPSGQSVRPGSAAFIRGILVMRSTVCGGHNARRGIPDMFRAANQIISAPTYKSLRHPAVLGTRTHSSFHTRTLTSFRSVFLCRIQGATDCILFFALGSQAQNVPLIKMSKLKP